ncbi:UBA domain-containing protein 14 [Beauveria bassiana D1-5]|uniref:UBA domain-containing protein 14 n=1 Tax=Beauveria bassiana D1-5 TaxID=1245745 RepID=A0A0A2VL56_BEABA|nr:UBA domain-containing protein 14 [Beauveria bassiana D1-5]
MTLTNTPVTRSVVLGLVSASIAASLLDIKHYAYILINPHIVQYGQFWRLFTYQLCYTNSAEVLFAAMSLYNLRTVERMWGSRKYAVIVPCRHVSNHVDCTACVHDSAAAAGAEPVQLHAGRPDAHHLCGACTISRHGAAHVQVPDRDVVRGCTSDDDDEQRDLYRADAVGQVVPVRVGAAPGAAAVARVGGGRGGGLGSGLGVARGSATGRVPGWVVGVKTQRSGAEFEQLRRRLEGENAATAAGGVGASTGVDAGGGGGVGERLQDGDRRRTMGQQIVDQFREAL